MYSTFYRDDRAAALNRVPYGSFALPERTPAEVARVVSIGRVEERRGLVGAG